MKLIEKYSFDEKGFSPVFQFREWKVAFLNYIDELKVENINYVECHLETDEIFVLLEGNCQMLLAHLEEDKISKIEFVNLEKNVAYNIPSGVYHNHILTENSKLFIVEQENTSYDNSKRIYLTEDEIQNNIKKWIDKYEL